MPYLVHYGVKGQKWGIRRYETDDGRLTIAGKLKRSSIKRHNRGLTGVASRAIAKRIGTTPLTVYLASQPLKNAGMGFLLAGPSGALAGAYVTAKRNKMGMDFIERMFDQYGKG